MTNKIAQKSNLQKRKIRVRSKVYGTSARPRLSVFRSNRYVTAQLIDDAKGTTVVSLGISDIKKIHATTNKVSAAYEVGKRIAELAKKKDIESIIFDRNGYRYHGRIKSVADGAREGGLNF